MAKMLAQGTEIFFIDPSQDVGESDRLVKINCPKTIDTGTPSTDEHDTTNLCSDAKEKFSGLTDWGNVTLSVDLDLEDYSHKRLIQLSEEQPRSVVKFVVGLPDGKDLPTIDSDGEFELSDTRTWRAFDGQVQSVGSPFNAGEVIGGEIDILVNKRFPTQFKDND